MAQNRQFQRMIWVSVILHFFLIGGILLLSFFRPEVTLAPSLEEPQFVDLYEATELPEDLPGPTMSQSAEEIQTQDVISFQTMSSLAPEPTPTSKPSPTPTPRPRVKPTSTPKKPLIPMPRYRSTPAPYSIRPAKKHIIPFELPKRPAVLLQRRHSQKGTLSPASQQTPGRGAGRSDTNRQLFLGTQSSEGSSVLLDQEDAFPFPEYLQSIKVKVEGLWIPQGRGTLSIYLTIARNGKILKSGVDKGEGVGVEKLRESVIRTLTLIKRFDPLPREYNGTRLQVRIIVRR